MPNKTLLHLSFILATIALASCAQVPPAPTSTPPPPTPTVPPDWQTRWLQKIPCAAPCVEGITPGKTTATEAIRLLSQNPLVRNVRNMPKADPAYKQGAVLWEWVSSGLRGSAGHRADSSELIQNITPNFGRDYALRDVMQAYGAPTFILGTAGYHVSEKPIYSQDVTLLWLQYGFYLDGYSSPLDQEARFRLLVFIPPTREAFEAGNTAARLHPDWLQPWEGFKGFQYYCRDGVNGKLCRGEQPPP